MEMLRILQKSSLQQLARTRPVRPNVRQLRIQTASHSRTTNPVLAITRHSLHTRFQSPFQNLQRFTGPFRSSVRKIATSTHPPTQNLSLSQRLKKLSREYGWSALGVYLFLSALDFPFCFLAVRMLGTDRVGHWEHVIISTVKEWVKWPFNQETQDVIDGAVHEATTLVKETIPVEELKDHPEKRVLEEDTTYVVVDHGYKEANAANKGSNASLWTQLALAYAIHKSFIFIRVPLTAAVLPKVVKTLRSWGYNIGKMPNKKVVAGSTPSGTAGVNTKGAGVKKD